MSDEQQPAEDVPSCIAALERMATALKRGGERGPTRNVSIAITKIEDAVDRLWRAVREDG